MELRGKVALVTGMTGGLGKRICNAFAERGCAVSGVYHKARDEAESYIEELTSAGHDAIAIQADVTAQDGITSMIETTQRRFGHIDILVLDAAYNRWIPFPDLDQLDESAWNYILNYNLTAPYLAARTVAPLMRKQGGGRIVMITSIAGIEPLGSSMAYAVSKAGLIHLTKCLAVGLAPDVLVNNVAPGHMDGTRMSSNLSEEHIKATREGTLLKRGADKDDVADAVVLMSRTDSITGQTLVIDSGKVFL
jgi:3-oxoacyl-[acyl-carrier protein] reductase